MSSCAACILTQLKVLMNIPTIYIPTHQLTVDSERAKKFLVKTHPEQIDYTENKIMQFNKMPTNNNWGIQY